MQRIPLTRADLARPLTRIARAYAAERQVTLSQARQELSAAFGYRDLHDMQAEASETLTLETPALEGPQVLPPGSALSGLVEALKGSVSEGRLKGLVSWRLHVQLGLPLADAAALVDRLPLKWLSVWDHTSGTRLKAWRTAGDTSWFFDETPSLFGPSEHPLSVRAVALGVPAFRYVVRRDGRVFSWERLQRIMNLVPEGVALSDAELTCLGAEAWKPLQEAWEETPFSPGFVLQSAGDQPGVMVCVPGWNGRLPGVWASREDAVQGWLSWLEGESPGVQQVESLTGEPLFYVSGRPLLSTLVRPGAGLPWRLLGLPELTGPLIPARWREALAELKARQQALEARARSGPRVQTRELVTLAFNLRSGLLKRLPPSRWTDPEIFPEQLRGDPRLEGLPERLVQALLPDLSESDVDLDSPQGRGEAARLVALGALASALTGRLRSVGCREENLVLAALALHRQGEGLRGLQAFFLLKDVRAPVFPQALVFGQGEDLLLGAAVSLTGHLRDLDWSSRYRARGWEPLQISQTIEAFRPLP